MKNNPTKKEASSLANMAKTLVKYGSTPDPECYSVAFQEDRLRAAIQDALTAERKYVRDALIAGQLMQEKCACLVIQKHGANPVHAREARRIFSKWLNRHCPDIPRSSAYLLMSFASHLMRLLLEIRSPERSEIPVWLHCEGKSIFISAVLKMAASECSQSLLTFRETLEMFLSDRDSIEDAICWIEGRNSADDYPPDHPKAGAIQPANPPHGMIQFFSVNLTPGSETLIPAEPLKPSA
ncbi:MAG TPA: hypothetical protein VH595_05985 [Verrucomicrobiae bacterium]|nr:hypothetical protein [Verrucomicrobiae bacterium]